MYQSFTLHSRFQKVLSTLTTFLLIAEGREDPDTNNTAIIDPPADRHFTIGLPVKRFA